MIDGPTRKILKLDPYPTRRNVGIHARRLQHRQRGADGLVLGSFSFILLVVIETSAARPDLVVRSVLENPAVRDAVPTH